MSMQIDEEDRKLFVGGLPQECTQDDLKEYFGKYGELERVQLKMDPTTGRSRGFAFILFNDANAMEQAAAEEHSIKGKKSTVKKADIKPGKIYLGKLPTEGVSEDDIRAYFGEFGVVTEVIRPIDKMKNNEPKNFCFITFEKERISKKMVQQGQAVINGHKLMIKEVTPNPRDPNARGGMRGGARGGGYGAAAGAWGQDQGYGGYGAAAWGADQGYGASAWDQSGYGGYGGYGQAAGGYGGGYGQAAGGYGAGAGGMGGGKMRGGRGGGAGGGRGRGRGRGTPY